LTAYNENNKVIGLATLILVWERENVVNVRLICLLAAPKCDVSRFLVDESDTEVIQILCDYILELKSEWDVISLSEFHKDYPFTPVIVYRFEKQDITVYKKESFHYYLALNDDWVSFYKKLSKNMRHDLKRRLCRAEEIGELKYQQIKGHDINWKHFETIFKINQKGKFPGLYKSLQDQELHRKLTHQMEEQDWMGIHSWFYQSREFWALTSRRISKPAVFTKFSVMSPWTSNLVK